MAIWIYTPGACLPKRKANSQLKKVMRWLVIRCFRTLGTEIMSTSLLVTVPVLWNLAEGVWQYWISMAMAYSIFWLARNQWLVTTVPQRKVRSLFRNLGKLQFADVSQEVGLTPGVPGLGVAVADVNNDGWPDFFLAAQGGGNVLFLNDGHGKFHELPREPFAWPEAKGDNMVCGITFGDVNRDGWLDMVLSQHYETPWKTR